MVWKKLIAVLIPVLSMNWVLLSQDASWREDGLGRRLDRVRELYGNDMYSAARSEIDDILRQYEVSGAVETELAAYGIVCDIRLGSPGLDALMEEYREKYRYAPEYMGVCLMYAGHYFDNEDYAGALRILDAVEYPLLSRDDKRTFLFQRSFCQLRAGRLSDARTGFDRLLKDRHDRYTVASTYYRGYIAYVDKDFRKAVKLLSSIRDDGHFGSYCEYYILESSLMLEDYRYVTDNGAAVLSAVRDKDMKAKVARMVSQAYYRLDSPEEARKWFESYTSSGAGMSRKDNYYLGIISYSLEAYRAAVEALGKVTGPEDSLSQSACLHIANSCLKLKNKHDALTYYKMAADMNFDEGIREEGFFNYAKLAFDLNSDIAPFQEYLKTYPRSGRSDEIYSYIAASCLLSKKYKAAIDALNMISRLTPEMDMNLQKAAFLRGMELFDRGSYGGAVTDFRIALDHSDYNASLALLTRFWLAEACYRSGRLDEAVSLNDYLARNSAFRSFKEYPLMLYGQGYNYFAKEDYESSIEWFNRFLDLHGPDMDLIIEAKLRVGDSFFMLRDYARAASVYEEVAMVDYNDGQVLYAAFQCAVAYGLLSDLERKMNILEAVMDRQSDSPVYTMAVYELGRTYVQRSMPDKAVRCFKYLLEEVEDPVYDGKALLELGMIYSNAGEYSQALSYLTRIVEEMPLSEDTENALAVIESIYVALNRPDDYFAYLERTGMSGTKTPDEKELMIFNAAEQIYLSGDYSAAISALESFISGYPDGQKTPLAYFYLGESLSATGRKEEAAASYAEVMDKGSGSFVELSTLHYAGICYDIEQYGKAAAAYEKLLDIAKLDNNRHAALAGTMRSYYMDGKYVQALEAASRVREASGADAEEQEEAVYIMAKSYMALGRRSDALPLLKELSKDNFTPRGAEAAYLLIQDTYDAGNFEEVENLVYAFSDSQTSQTYWLAKSFIVLGDSFAEREEWNQARATFESIRDGYEPGDSKDDVLDQVNMRLARMDRMEEQS